MNRQAFLDALRGLAGALSEEERARLVSYYAEMIDDRMEEGMTEEEAVAALGSIDEIAAQILGETSVVNKIKQKIRRRRALKTWEIVLLAAGAPLWLTLLLSAFAIFVTIAVLAAAGTFTLCAVDLSLLLLGIAGVLGGIVLSSGGFSLGAFVVGAALVLLGLSIFLYMGCKCVVKSFAWSFKRLWYGVRSLSTKRGEDVA